MTDLENSMVINDYYKDNSYFDNSIDKDDKMYDDYIESMLNNAEY